MRSLYISNKIKKCTHLLNVESTGNTQSRIYLEDRATGKRLIAISLTQWDWAIRHFRPQIIPLKQPVQLLYAIEKS